MPILVRSAKHKWSNPEASWRLDIRYIDTDKPRDDGEPSRTYVNLRLIDKDRDANKARRAAAEFGKETGEVYGEWMAKRTGRAISTAPVEPLPEKRNGVTIDRLLRDCLDHPEVWGSVAARKNYVSGVRVLCHVCGDDLVEDFDPANGGRARIHAIRARLAEGRATGSVRKLMGHLRQALRAAIGEGVSEPVWPRNVRCGLSDIPSFPMIAKSPRREAIVHPDQDRIIYAAIDRLIAAARAEEEIHAQRLIGLDPESKIARGITERFGRWKRYSSTQLLLFRDFFTLLMETGMRRTEALSCGPHSIQRRAVVEAGRKTGEIAVLVLSARMTKTAKPREINISPTLAAMLARLNEGAATRTLERRGEMIEIKAAWFPFVPNVATNLWSRVRKEAGMEDGAELDDVVLHAVRHSNATRLRARGMPIDELANHLGHSNIRTTLENYDHLGNQKTIMSRHFFNEGVGFALDSIES